MGNVPSFSARDSERITVLMCTFNARDCAQLCLQSFLRTSPSFDGKWLVLDNGSTDGCLEYLGSVDDLMGLTIERGEQSSAHEGLGAGLDRLTAMVDTEFFMTVHSDVCFMAPGWVEALAQPVFEDERFIGTGPWADLGGDDLICPTGGYWYPHKVACHLTLFRTALWRQLGLTWCTAVTDFLWDVGSEVARAILDSVRQSEHRYLDLPDGIERDYVKHFGQMSWPDESFCCEADRERRDRHRAEVRDKIEELTAPASSETG